ncbi:FAD-binding oxidoreductase [Dokdonella koreensis]|uniref:FAD linked oxidase domain protein n=1 Tax=Dokdonella koreensis DS-123 TaxID=1300342 RepID=A0A167G982_9GAMM|nr:FAD-binding oxidoreductase [Dokdonella koreensis]ANB16289.1 FAD linked oxidase domain protein [Dokdonella koreensis DS-123]
MPNSHDPHRRQLLRALALGGSAAVIGCGREDDVTYVSDVVQIDRIPVAGIASPASTPELQQLLRASRTPVSVGGARYSMGGQIAAEGSLHLDMRAMNRLVRLDVAARTVRVQAGMCWRDLQDIIDTRDLSVKIMQSYSNFSIGGSVSVNCHGRYVGAGPLAHSIRALQVVTADGEVHELDRNHQPELFAACIGGYGGLGVISEVELDLADNAVIERQARWIPLEAYPDFFRESILGNPDAVLHNADLMPPDFNRPLAVSWMRSDAPLTDRERLVPRHLDYGRDQNLIWVASELPVGGRLRERFQTDRILQEKAVVLRNREASLDATSLEPRTRIFSTYLLQEYFIPVAGFARFATQLAGVLQRHEVNALNVSIRHSPADAVSLLKWAATEVFSFVLYYKQRSFTSTDERAADWTRQLVDAALSLGGRYYLPYRLHATPQQFRRAYPEADDFARIKRAVDPYNRFRNRLWDKYLPSP